MTVLVNPYTFAVAAPVDVEWAFVGVSALVTSTNVNLTLTQPVGVVAGDLLVACIASRTTATTPITPPVGWVQVGGQFNNNTLGTTSAVPSAQMSIIVRGASAPPLTFVHPAGINVSIGQIVAYRGCHTSPYNAVTAVTTAVNTTAVSVAGLTTTVDNDLIVALAAGGQEAAWSSFNATSPSGASGATDTTTAPGAAWIERADTSTVTGADTSLAIFDAVKAAAGVTGNLTATASLAAGHVIIAGAFKKVPSAGGGTWTETFAQTLAAGDWVWNQYTMRAVISAANLSASGTQTRLTLQAGGPSAYTDVVAAYIGHQAVSGDPFDFDGTPVPITVGASSSFTIPAETSVVTDALLFALDETKAVVISVAHNLVSTVAKTEAAASGVDTYYKLEGAAGEVDSTGYAQQAGWAALVNKIEVLV